MLEYVYEYRTLRVRVRVRVPKSRVRVRVRVRPNSYSSTSTSSILPISGVKMSYLLAHLSHQFSIPFASSSTDVVIGTYLHGYFSFQLYIFKCEHKLTQSSDSCLQRILISSSFLLRQWFCVVLVVQNTSLLVRNKLLIVMNIKLVKRVLKY